MSAESYSLAEAAELLGVSKRTLQRQIRDGAFPGRFLAPSAHGMEMRLPAVDVAHAGGKTDGLSVRSRDDVEWSEGQLATIPKVPVIQSSSALTVVDVQVLREGLMSLIREERAVFLAEVRAAVERRDESQRGDIEEMKIAVQEMSEELARVRTVVSETNGASNGSGRWVETLGGKPSELDVDDLLSELGELEAMLGLTEP